MSASILWEPVTNSGRNLPVSAPSWFMGCLERAGMELPRVFSREDIPVLRGLAAYNPDERNPFAELIKVINKHGEIEVWYEH